MEILFSFVSLTFGIKEKFYQHFGCWRIYFLWYQLILPDNKHDWQIPMQQVSPFLINFVEWKGKDLFN